MTLILSLITPRYVMQASDRKITTFDDSGALTYKDDDHNKALFVAERLAFAYTGHSEITGVPSAEFMQRRLGDAMRRGLSPEDALDDAAEMIGQYLATLRPGVDRSLAFVGVGWTDEPLMAQRTPLHVWTSNVIDAEGLWTGHPAATFTRHSRSLAPGESFSLLSSGVDLSPPHADALGEDLSQLIDGHEDPEAVAVVLANTIRRVADEDKAVGHGLMVTTLPIAPWSLDGSIQLMAGPPKLDVRTFSYLPPGSFDGELLGPLIVTSGGQEMGNFRASGSGLVGPGGGTAGIMYSLPGAPPMKHGKIGQRIKLDRPKRNDPCPCGSGRKFKKCHGP